MRCSLCFTFLDKNLSLKVQKLVHSIILCNILTYQGLKINIYPIHIIKLCISKIHMTFYSAPYTDLVLERQSPIE